LGREARSLRLLTNIGIGQHLSPRLFSIGPYLILTILPLVLLVFWLVRVRFSAAYNRRAQRAAA
jgi:hypothetical protein